MPKSKADSLASAYVTMADVNENMGPLVPSVYISFLYPSTFIILAAGCRLPSGATIITSAIGLF